MFGGLAALAIVLVLVATNAFGFRDKLNAVGKAIGDAVPALQPLLLGLKMIGEALGLTGNDAKTTAKDMQTAMQNMDTATHGLATAVTTDVSKIQADLNSISLDMATHNYQKGLTDIGKLLQDYGNTYDDIWASIDAVAFAALSAFFTNVGGLITTGAAGMAKRLYRCMELNGCMVSKCCCRSNSKSMELNCRSIQSAYSRSNPNGIRRY